MLLPNVRCNLVVACRPWSLPRLVPHCPGPCLDPQPQLPLCGPHHLWPSSPSGLWLLPDLTCGTHTDSDRLFSSQQSIISRKRGNQATIMLTSPECQHSKRKPALSCQEQCKLQRAGLCGLPARTRLRRRTATVFEASAATSIGQPCLPRQQRSQRQQRAPPGGSETGLVASAGNISCPR